MGASISTALRCIFLLTKLPVSCTNLEVYNLFPGYSEPDVALTCILHRSLWITVHNYPQADTD